MSLSRRSLLLAGSAAALSAGCAPSASSAAPALKLGVLVPFTEQAIDRDIGAAQKRAADLYVKRQGGKLAGREVKLVYSDESIDPQLNQVKIRQLLDQEQVDVIMGGGATPTAYAIRDAAEAARIIYLDTHATGNALTRAAPGCKPSCKSKYVFRTAASSWQLGEPLGEWVSKSGPKEFFLCHADDAFGTETAAAFVDGLGNNAAKVTGRSTAPPHSAGWAKVVASIKEQPTKHIFGAFYTDDAEGFVKAWNELGMSAAGYKLYGPGLLTDVEVLKATKGAAVGAVTSLFWSETLDNAENKALADLFRKEYKDDETGEPLAPDVYAVQMWDAMRALDEALKRTKGNTKEPDGLIAALEAVSFKSPRGDFAFDTATHNPIQDVYVREVKGFAGGAMNAVIDKAAKVADPGT